MNSLHYIFLLRHLMNTYQHALICSCKKIGLPLTYGEIEVLLLLRKKDDLKQSDLAEGLLKDKASITRLINKLINKGWIKSQRGSKDRRTVFAQLTPDGKQVAQSVFSLVSEYEKSVYYNITQKELDGTKSVLHRMIENIRN